MTGTYLKFYIHENRRHRGKLVYEWLLAVARELGIHGGSAFRAIAGFGRHGLVEQRFYELADNLPVEVVFMLSEAETERILAASRRKTPQPVLHSNVRRLRRVDRRRHKSGNKLMLSWTLVHD